MAIAILGKKSRIGILKQTGWASPQAANANFVTMNYDVGSIPDPKPMIENINQTSQAGIYKETTRMNYDYVSDLKSINFSGLIHQKLFAPHLFAAMQAVTEGATTPYDKAFVMQLTAPLDFAADAGCLHTVAFDIGASADDGVILENAVLDTLSIDFDLNAKGMARYGKMTGTWVGNEMNFEQTLNGSWVAIPTIAYYANTDAFTASTFTINAVNYAAECIRSFGITINNNVSIPCQTAGKAAQYRMSPMVTFRIGLESYNLTTEKILQSYQRGDAVVLTFKNGVTADTDGELGFVIAAGHLTDNPYVYDGEYVGLTLGAEATKTSGSPLLQVNMTDTVDWAY
ncbi:MAG: hypothetical protein IPJ03_17610 [Ignavibacteriales bacterium]|nr:hypothetical protein [Ignavibacteriales bacterium]MBK7380752.1 hypothetical protein [Ignavibacteriales bacterium]MBK7380778.1 hypothetical protein [Ignavibacteriales bacterium]